MTAPCRILYVDEHKDSRDLVSIMLKYGDLDCEIVATGSGRNAMSLAADQSFDLYILDSFLPEISGLELCRQIRKNDAKTPIMFFSTQDQPKNRAEAFVAGAQEYLTKPHDLNKLLKTAERLIGSINYN